MARRAAPPRPRRILMMASEVAPFVKTGGLADVMGALPEAVARLGWDVTVALPRYGRMSGNAPVGALVDRFPITLGGQTSDVGFFEAPLGDRVRAVLVDCPDLLPDRDGPYGIDGVEYADNPRRFAMLVRGALEYAARREPPPSIIHAHDWQTGLAPVYLKTLYATHPVLAGTPSVFTIHNLAYQGLVERDWLGRLDLPWGLFTIEQLEYWGRISLLKAGINFADLITTVSPRYAREIGTPEFGFGFDGILRRRTADLVGILNGIDTTEWDPAADPFLPAPYDARNPSGKSVSKAAVLSRYRLPTDEQGLQRPLIGMIPRMVDQKGFDLIAGLVDTVPRLGANFVVLGTGEARYCSMWTRLASEHPDRIGAHIGFDEPLAHLIEAGADMFLMPSRFEPCGLNQMYSLRYGTVPIVRAVGGLADTVTDYSPGRVKSTGFVFQEYSPGALLEALERALAVFANRPRWLALQAAGMGQDHSWDRSAREYVKLYERAIKRAAQATGLSA